MEEELNTLFNEMEKIQGDEKNPDEIFRKIVEKVKLKNKAKKHQEGREALLKLEEEKNLKYLQRQNRYKIRGPIVYPPPWVLKRKKGSSKKTSAQESVKDSIDNSIKAREDSIEELLKANAATESVKEEISEIEENCDNSITALNEKIEKETDVQIENIHKNTEKIINSENKQIVSELSGKTALAAVELAKKHIKEVLKNKPQYHQKFIEESINELESGLK